MHAREQPFPPLQESASLLDGAVSKDYRAAGVLEDDTMIRFWIGTHAEYDRLLKGV